MRSSKIRPVGRPPVGTACLTLCGLLLSGCGGQLEAADDSVENTLERLEISADSSLYPELSELFSAKIEAWRQSVRDAEKISDA